MKRNKPDDWMEWRKYVLAELKRLAKDTTLTHKQLAQLNETLIRNTISLEEHVKRTNLLEAKVGHIDAHVKKVQAIGWLFSKDNLVLKALLAAAAVAGAILVRKYM